MNVQQSLLKRIHEQLVQGDHNEIDMVFQDGAATGSKIILTSLSPYFDAMFSCDMKEKNTGIVTLPTVSKKTFDDVLQVYFFGENVVNEVNCFLLLDVADMMQLKHLKSLCLDYLDNNLRLTPETCIRVWRSAKKSAMEALEARACQYMVRNVEQLSKRGQMLSLTKSEYVELLLKDDLQQKEDDILQDVQTWIKTNKPAAEDMADIFKQIRFNHVSLRFLTQNVIFDSIVREHEEIQLIVQKGLTQHCEMPRDVNSFINNRSSGQIQNVMFVLNKSINILYAASLTDFSWYEIPAAPCDPGDWFSACALGNCIYITGGTVKRRSTMKYDVWTKTWSFGPDLNHERCEHCMAGLADTIYVIGGRTNSIEQLRECRLDWEVVADLGCSRRDSCAESVGENILVMGGIVNWYVSDNLQCFNTKTRAVCTIPVNENCGQLIRSFLLLPDLYLVHSDGTVELVHVEESSVPTLTTRRLIRQEEYGYYFGFVYNEGYLVVITGRGLQKVKISDESKEDLDFDNVPQLGNICGCLNMHVPRFCLQ